MQKFEHKVIIAQSLADCEAQLKTVEKLGFELVATTVYTVRSAPAYGLFVKRSV
mgnify:CR=1 FL=1